MGPMTHVVHMFICANTPYSGWIVETCGQLHRHRVRRSQGRNGSLPRSELVGGLQEDRSVIYPSQTKSRPTARIRSKRNARSMERDPCPALRIRFDKSRQQN